MNRITRSILVAAAATALGASSLLPARAPRAQALDFWDWDSRWSGAPERAGQEQDRTGAPAPAGRPGSGDSSSRWGKWGR